jgi:glutamine---fructose-6-phosphate transaminase (isomerizing)
MSHAEHRPHGTREVPLIPRTESTSEFQPLEDKEVEYFFASDASAVIEHTNRVIYLEVSLKIFKISVKFQGNLL